MEKRLRISPGMRLTYWDEDMNGHMSICGPVEVIRARGTGLRVRMVKNPDVVFRLVRGDVAAFIKDCTCKGTPEQKDCDKCYGDGWVDDRPVNRW